MARKSRKTPMPAEDKAVAAFEYKPERIYHTAAYVRLSVEDNRYSKDRESIAVQQYMLEKYIEGQKDMQLSGIYVDNGETGTNFDRPGFERMMDAVRRREVDCIVVKDLSRFGRNYVETGYYLEKIFPYLGVRFVSVNDGYDTSKDDSGNELVVSLKNLINDMYAKDISGKIHASLETKRKSGEFIGSFPPYGYLKSPADKHKLIVDPETAPIIKEIFAWRAEGVGCAQIARRLNERNIPCPSVYHYMRGHRKNEPTGARAVWQGQMVRKLTVNLVYAGHMAQGKEQKPMISGGKSKAVPREEWVIVENTHEAIVDAQTFEQVQKLTEERHAESCALRGKYATTENVLKGLVVCADCDTKMMRYKSVYPSGKAHYTFLCGLYEQNRSVGKCSKKWVKEEDLKEAVFQGLRVQMEAALDLEKLCERVRKNEHFQVKCRELEREIGKLEQGIKRKISLRSTLFESYFDKTITEDEYLSMKEKYEKEEAKLREQLERLEAKRTENERYSGRNEWLRLIRKYGKEKKITREMATELVKCIRVSGYNEIEIVWNFQDAFEKLKADAEREVV